MRSRRPEPRALKTALAISTFFSACILIPAPVAVLLPLTVGASELSPWIVVFNLACAAAAFKMYRAALFFFIANLVISAWPLCSVQVVQKRMAGHLGGGPRFGLLNCFRNIPAPEIEPEILPLNILYYRARIAGPRPALVDIYGGAWQRGSPEDSKRFHCYMASRGYAVFAVDYRHAPAWRFPAQIEDIRAAIALIHGNASRYGIDPDRLVICGRSSGAQLALLAAYEGGGVPIRAVVSFYGPTDLARGYADPPSPDPLHVRAVLEAYLGGPPIRIPDTYRAASPVTYAGKRALPATLLIQGKRDHVVKPEFAGELYRKLIASGNRAVLLEIPWAEHSFDSVFHGLGNRLSLFYLERFLETFV